MMSRVWHDVGVIAGIDANVRALIDDLQIFIPVAVARAALARAPDIDSEEVVAWGTFTRAEAERLFETQADAQIRADYVERLASMMETSPERNVAWCLYYARDPRV